MLKSDIVKRIAADALVTPLAAETAVDILLSEIGDALARGEKVTIRGFGSFSTTDRAPRVGRHPRTGEPIDIPASRSVAFKASRVLKDAVNRGLSQPALLSPTATRIC